MSPANSQYWQSGGGPPVGWGTFNRNSNNNQAAIQPLRLRPIDYFPDGRALVSGTGSTAPGTSQQGATNEKLSSDWTEHADWEHFDAHRDRRDLYKSLEGMMYVWVEEDERYGTCRGYDLSISCHFPFPAVPA